MKSSKQLTYTLPRQRESLTLGSRGARDDRRIPVRTFRSRVPARCHSSPNSPPPRMFATARMAPYFCIQLRMAGLKNGLIEIVKPP